MTFREKGGSMSFWFSSPKLILSVVCIPTISLKYQATINRNMSQIYNIKTRWTFIKANYSIGGNPFNWNYLSTTSSNIYLTDVCHLPPVLRDIFRKTQSTICSFEQGIIGWSTFFRESQGVCAVYWYFSQSAIYLVLSTNFQIPPPQE